MVNDKLYIDALIKHLTSTYKNTQDELLNWLLNDIDVNNISDDTRDEILGKVVLIIVKSFENPKVPGKLKDLQKKFVKNTLNYLTRYTIFDYKSSVLIHSFLTKEAKNAIANTEFYFYY